MDVDIYQEFTRSTIGYPIDREGQYLTAGIIGEVGEFMSAAAKYHRGDYGSEEFLKRAKGELGDIMWFVARLSDYYGWPMSEILIHNRDKLIDRQNRDVIKGDGDFR
jgi:NTP pyrophosphatase (non-canonical NTP hydrolase)